MACGFKEQARTRHHGEKSGLDTRKALYTLHHSCRKAIELLNGPGDLAGTQPVDLDHAPLSLESSVSVIGMAGTPKCKQRPVFRLHFDGIILDIALRAHQAQTGFFMRPFPVRVDQNGDYLAPVIGMDVTIAGFTVIAHRNRLWTGTQIDSEFPADMFGELRTVQFVQEGLEGLSVFQTVQIQIARHPNGCLLYTSDAADDLYTV